MIAGTAGRAHRRYNAGASPGPPSRPGVNRMKLCLAVAVVLAVAAAGRAAVHTETVTHKQGDTVCEGFLAYDDSQPGKRPGVLVVHEWLGLNDYAKHRAEMLA